MKQLNQYIIEKFKLNSNNTKGSLSYFTENILSVLYEDINKASKEEIKLISDWEKEVELKDLRIITTTEVLKNYQLIDPDNGVTLEDIKKSYETNDIKFVFSGSLYDIYEKLNGELKYEDQYGYDKYYICKNDNDVLVLKYVSRSAGCIIFCPGPKTLKL